MATPWRDHPRLCGRFHADYPDDLQVIVHEGGPSLASSPPEVLWARVTAVHGDVFTGSLLSQPRRLATLAAGDTILFIVPEGGEHPLRVTEQYLEERCRWQIDPCDKCGLTELLDAPSDLIRSAVPDRQGCVSTFTTSCPMCGGVQVVRAIDPATAQASQPGGPAWAPSSWAPSADHPGTPANPYAVANPYAAPSGAYDALVQAAGPRQSGLGIASFALAMFVILVQGAAFVFVGAMANSGADPSTMSPAVPLAIGFGVLGSLGLDFVAIGLGIGALCQPHRKRAFGLLGLAISGLTLMAWGLLIVAVMPY